MNLNDLKKNWDQFGREDPYWAIITDPEKKGNKWDEEEFFESGRLRINQVVRKLNRLKLFVTYKSALDFGCGAGRLTQGLANHFEEAHGVDIAPSMIQLANAKNKKENCIYHLNEQNDLSLFKDDTFDFVFSEITLQHMQPKYAKKYIAEFLRVVRPGGVVMFQIPSKPDLGTRIYHRIPGKLKYWLLRMWQSGQSSADGPIMEMYWIPNKEMIAFIENANGQIEYTRKNKAAGPKWESYTYIVSKP